MRVVKILELWTDPAFGTHPFYVSLVNQLINHIKVFFPGIQCEKFKNPPKELNFQYLKENRLI